MTSVLVLPSSLGTTTELWDANADDWSGTLRLVRYQLGGRTSIDELGRELIRLLDELQLERVSICGLSLGGAAAMWAAATAPERIDRLVLACTSARFGPSEPWLERAAIVRERGLEPIADGVVTRWFTPAASADVVARFRRMLVATPRKDYAACCEALARWDFRDRLGEIAAPTLVVAAADDPATPPSQSELIAEHVPSAKLVVLSDAAHLANVEQPKAFSRLVSEHLAPVGVA